VCSANVGYDCHILVCFILLDIVFVTSYFHVLGFGTECMYSVVIVITELSFVAKTVTRKKVFFFVSV
jgi:hypothetical protein